MQFEEISECSQGSTAIGGLNSEEHIAREDCFQNSHSSFSSTNEYCPPQEERTCTSSEVAPVVIYSDSEQNHLLHEVGTPGPQTYQQSSDNQNVNGSTSLGNSIVGYSKSLDEVSLSEACCMNSLTQDQIDSGFSVRGPMLGSNIMNLVDNCGGQLLWQSESQDLDFSQSLGSCSQPHNPQRSLAVLATSSPQTLLPVVSLSLVCPDGRLTSVNEDTGIADISTGMQDLDLISCPSDTFIYPNNSIISPCGDDKARGCMFIKSDELTERPKSIPMDDFGSLATYGGGSLNSEDAIETPVKKENQDLGGLFYEPPRFPSLEIPFVSCDLIQSGSEAYSPLGIRQLMMSSMNCSSPYRLWDPPPRYDSPDMVLKSAAKSYLHTPSILKKRHRDLLSPLQERSDKRFGKDCSRLDIMFEGIGGCRTSMSTVEIAAPYSIFLNKKFVASPGNKENLDISSEDKTVFLEGRILEKGHEETKAQDKSGADSTTREMEQPTRVLVEHNKNDLLLISPSRDAKFTNRPMVIGTPMSQLSRSLEITSNQIESSSWDPCFSGLLSPTSSERKRGNHLAVPQPLQVTVEKDGLPNNVCIENISIFADTPGFKRGLESPSAWKSPWFMNSFLPGHRFDTDITVEDIGLFTSPGDRSYDAIGLMKQLSEHTAAVFADAQEVLACESQHEAIVSNVDERNTRKQNPSEEIPDKELGHLSALPSNLMPSQTERVLDFSGCDTPRQRSKVQYHHSEQGFH